MNPSLRSVALFATLLYVFHLVTCGTRETFMIAGARGDEVVDDVASKIGALEIFKDKPIKEFLKRIYYFNDHTPGSLDIYKVTDDIKELQKVLKPKDAEEIVNKFKITMSHVTLENMTIPLYHGIVISLKVLKINKNYGNPDDQAQVFQEMYGKVNDDVYKNEFKRYVENIDKCTKDSCKNNGVCIIGEDPPKCICDAPYHGQICQRKASTCNDGKIKCPGRGYCAKDKNKNLIKCECFSGSTGRQCTIHAIKCSDIQCENGGTCEVSKYGYLECKCTDKYYGIYCEIKRPVDPGTTSKPDGGKKSSASMLPYTSVLSFVTVVLSYALI